MIPFTFCICVISAVSCGFIISEEYIFNWLRKWAEKTKKEPIVVFLHCPVCLSWWAGLFSAIYWGWWCIPVAFASALLAKIIRIFEG